VGFTHYTAIDSTRTYSRVFDFTPDKIPRPVPVSIWYPSNEGQIQQAPLTVLDYFRILKEEEEWESLPDEQLLNWFYYPNTAENQRHLTEKTTAYHQLEAAAGKFPTILYAPSHEASSVENFALCEYLASYGYVVIAGPSRGADHRRFGSNPARAMETQARDVELLLEEINKFSVADPENIGAMGFSFGGLANMLVTMRNDRIKALLSLDGTERYQYNLLASSPFFDPSRLTVPYLHLAQKEIPQAVLEADRIDPALNSRFELFDQVTNARVHKIRMNDLTHTYFSTMGILFAQRDKRQDKSDQIIMAAFEQVANYSLNFFDAYLKSSPEGRSFVDNTLSDERVSRQVKTPVPTTIGIREFNTQAAAQNYEDLTTLHQTMSDKHPGLILTESDLNILGLQLLFRNETSHQGINVLLLATEIYPASANLFDSLAEGYLHIGDQEKAIVNFEKSLQYYPDNQNAIRRLKKLRRSVD
ncbi:MAG: alpha/beta hydrolase, partial [Bacteroidota bacterium]